jgi:esterase/lipase superfamily enzyme
MLVGCESTGVEHTQTTGIFGKGSSNRCFEYCIEKVDVDGGEQCVKYAPGMANICLKESGKVYPRNTFILRDSQSSPSPQLFKVVSVFFATDRKQTGPAIFGTERAKTLTYGVVQVNIPRDHTRGEPDRPSWIRLKILGENPHKDMMIMSTTIASSADFLSALREKVHDSSRKSLLVFIHGFRVSFEDAALRTAQMAYDLQFDGAAVFFSWPSQDALWSYSVDEQSIVNAEPHLEHFLHEVLEHSDADSVYLIAHSMGNRGLARALVNLAASDPTEVKRIKEVILTAPDIDSTEFTEQIAPGLKKLGAPVTLYASSNDKALAMSKSLHGGNRAGEAGPNIVVVNGIETIDVSQLETDFIGHAYPANNASVLVDIWYLVHDDMRASQRCCLNATALQGRPFWIYAR